MTDQILKKGVRGMAGITRYHPNEWIPNRVRRAEYISEATWRLRQVENTSVLEISRMFCRETIGGNEQTYYTPTADVWFYSEENDVPYLSKTNNHSNPKLLITQSNFSPAEWQPLAATLAVFHEAIMSTNT